MRILFNMGHPAQVHLFKNLIWKFTKVGHQCKITVINKDVSLRLLDAYDFNYDVIGSAKPSLLSKAAEMLRVDYRLYQIAKSFKPDILVGGVGNVYVAHVGKLIKKPSIVFDDSEHAKIEHLLTDPFVTLICTPSCFSKKLGKKQLYYNSYHELAYLHPNYFNPNPKVLDELGLCEKDIFIVLRFVSWTADHDIGQSGIKNKVKFVRELEKYGKVFITSEGQLDPVLDKYKIKVSPEKLHDLLYYATLHVGEGGSTASEAAVLGTHVVLVSTMCSGYLYDEAKFGLVDIFSDPKNGEENALQRSVELLQNKKLKEESQSKRSKLLQSKIDLTPFMQDVIEKCVKNNY